MIVAVTVDAAAQVRAIGLHINIDRGAGRPKVFRAPAQLLIVQPVESALHRRVGGDADGVLGSLPINNGLGEVNADHLANADRGIGKGGQISVSDSCRFRRGELDSGGSALSIMRDDGVRAVETQGLVRRPALLVRAQLGLDDLAVLIGHGDVRQRARQCLDCNGLGGVDVCLAVVHRCDGRKLLFRRSCGGFFLGAPIDGAASQNEHGACECRCDGWA